MSIDEGRIRTYRVPEGDTAILERSMSVIHEPLGEIVETSGIRMIDWRAVGMPPIGIQTWLANVDWEANTPSEEDVSSGLPYATHTGIWNDPLFGLTMRCYRLNNG